MKRKPRMKKTDIALAAIGAITLFAILSVAPGAADARRYRAGPHWRHGAPDVIVGDGLRRGLGDGQRRYFGQGRRYFGADPGRYFGVGPGSYECVGYDCNW
jgi:hypothetical protein